MTSNRGIVRWARKILRRPCQHEDVVAVYGIDGPRLHCRDCGFSERISMQEWRSL